MRFLADENTHSAIMDWLRKDGHDVVRASEISSGEPDLVWLRRAVEQERILLTSDKDFGDLVYLDSLPAYGVILLRIEGLSADERIDRLKECWGVIEANPQGRCIVISRSRIRVRPLT